ncbi:MAG TPA: sigma-54 dependent transcriptional regulator [Acidobacteriota bacterium]|nr:sigma-54 dependent transcriptional regulator [Acidobacteriota bacterium]
MTKMCERILVVEDDERVRSVLCDLLNMWGYEVEVAADGTQGWEKIVSTQPIVVLSDLRLPGLSGLELLKKSRELYPGVCFIMLSGHGTIQSAVEATRLGAFDFLEKPVDPDRLQVELKNCMDRRESERQLEIAHRKLRDLGALGKLVGRSKKMQEIMSLITMVAPTSASVLITGESGTGKEIVARTIHELSPYRSSPFIAVNCAAIPESLIESELFGHEKGAFTGAIQARMGCFELAQSGTLLLDEIGDMPINAQAKLLRILEDSRVRRLGAKSEIPVAVRVVAATNKDPEAAVQGGQLRSDLFYRLNVIRISMPALREHMDDLEDLASAFVEDLNQKYNRSVQSIDAGAIELLRRYSWPGNVRELRNTLERAVVTCRGAVIKSKDLSPRLRGEAEPEERDQIRISPGLTVEEVERRLILATLSHANQNKTRAAALLGITVKTLHSKLKKYAGASIVH